MISLYFDRSFYYILQHVLTDNILGLVYHSNAGPLPAQRNGKAYESGMNSQGIQICIMAFALCTAVSSLGPISAEDAGPREIESSEQIEERGETGLPDDSHLLVLSLPFEDVSVEQWLKESGWRVQRGNTRNYRIEDGALFMKNIDATTVIGREFVSFSEDSADEPVPAPNQVYAFKIAWDESPYYRLWIDGIPVKINNSYEIPGRITTKGFVGVNTITLHPGNPCVRQRDPDAKPHLAYWGNFRVSGK